MMTIHQKEVKQVCYDIIIDNISSNVPQDIPVNLVIINNDIHKLI